MALQPQQLHTADNCVLNNFKDGSKFKYNNKGQVCFSNDCSSWAKRVLHNLPLDDYLESEALVPPKAPFTVPNFGTKERPPKQKKETIDNYVEACESCTCPFEGSWTYQFYGKLVCKRCLGYFKKQVCRVCKQPTVLAKEFIQYAGPSDFVDYFVFQVLIKNDEPLLCTFCEPCLKIYKRLHQ